MERLLDLIGREHDVDEVARTLYTIADELRAPVVGAMQVTCSDESERECIDAFHNNVVEPLLPSLKFGTRSRFRIANLGGRYERGAVAIAEDHYSTEEAAGAFKLLVVKVNSHVSVESTSDGRRFGSMRRYDAESVYCGALHALMDGSKLPFAKELRELFRSGGKDRLGTLLDKSRVEPDHRSLFAAVVNARLQVEGAVDDIREFSPRTPTFFLLLACVTLNREGKDTEIVCGVWQLDRRSSKPLDAYRGLGDDPSAYRLTIDRGQLLLDEEP
jgi:hypothetical protein